MLLWLSKTKRLEINFSMLYLQKGGAAGTAGTALAGPLFMAIRPHPQLNFCGLSLESTLSFVRVFTFYQNKSILLESEHAHCGFDVPS